MGSKNKPCQGEYDMPNLTSPTQVHGKSHMRQFSTKSKAKGSASFKGLRRVLTHDGTFEGDGLLNRHGSFKKSKSSDALYRRRAISGLNMTALVGEKPTNRVSRSQGNSRLSSPIQSLSKVTVVVMLPILWQVPLVVADSDHVEQEAHTQF